MYSDQDDLTAWMNVAGRNPVLPKEEVLRIARLIQGSEKGSPKHTKFVNKLVLHNLRLVIAFVHPFMSAKSANKWGSAESLDYLQVGVLGLRRAAELYDPVRGYAFSTYANHWIRSFVGRYNMRASTAFKVPEHDCRAMYYFEKYGKINEKEKLGQIWREDPEQMSKLVKSAQAPYSLYSETENGGVLIDYLQVAQEEPVEFYEDGFSPEVERLLAQAKLTDQEDSVIRSVFVHNFKPQEVCSKYGFNIVAYGKIKNKALKKIRKIASPVMMEV